MSTIKGWVPSWNYNGRVVIYGLPKNVILLQKSPRPWVCLTIWNFIHGLLTVFLQVLQSSQNNFTEESPYVFTSKY